MKNKILKIILYVCAIFCIIYPLYSKYKSFKNQTISIYNYDDEVAKMNKDEIEKQKENTDNYNEKITKDSEIVTPEDMTGIANGTSSYDFLQTGNMIGHISIPKINTELPIYEGTSANELLKGLGHIETSSLPSGKVNTHSVLAGHTGITQAEILDNLDKVEINDEFYITYYDQTTKYKVIDKRVVLPSDTSSLKIEEGKCLVTLVTCTPKGINSHRLLVTGQKVDEVQNENETNIDNEEQKDTLDERDDEFKLLVKFILKNIRLLLFIIAAILILIAFCNVVNIIADKKKSKK